MLKIGICEDEQNVLNQISCCIQEALNNEIEYSIKEYNFGMAMLKDREIFDLVILDLDMSGMKGYELAREIRELDTEVKIVFITNYSIYKDYAFSVHAFGYLVKPVNRDIFLLFSEIPLSTFRQEKKTHNRLNFCSRKV